MKIFRSKGYACDKHLISHLGPTHMDASTTSLGQSRRVSLADWTTLF